jgi:hypothetical protein
VAGSRFDFIVPLAFAASLQFVARTVRFRIRVMYLEFGEEVGIWGI